MPSSVTAVARERSPAPPIAALPAESAPVARKEEATKKASSSKDENVDDEADKKRSPPPEEDPAEVDARVRALYYVMQSVESRLGGGEGVEGLYGSITRTGTARVLSSLQKHSGLGPLSHLVDVGAGLGRPLLHALADPGVAAASGVELDPVKCEKAGAFAVQARSALLLRRGRKKEEQVAGGAAGGGGEEGARGTGGEEGEGEEAAAENWTLPSLPDIQCCPVEALPSLDPATHVYSFWEGVPPAARAAFGRLVAGSRTVRGVAVVQRAMRSRGGGGGGGGDSDGEGEEGGPPSSSSSSVPEAVMRDYGFGKLELRDAFAVSMSGSGRSFRAYVFSREVAAAEAPEPETPAASSGASEQTAAVVPASESPESKPRPPSSSSAFARPLPRACPLLAAAALAAERAAKEERKNGGSGWKNITTPTKPSPLSSPSSRGPWTTPGSVSSSSSSTLLFSSSSSSSSFGGGICDREARRARRRAGLSAAPSLPPSLPRSLPHQGRQAEHQVSIQSFCRVLRRAGVGAGGPTSGKGKAAGAAAAAASPSSKGGSGGGRLARSSSSKGDSALAPAAGAAAAAAASGVLSPAGKVLASPKKAGVTKGGKGGNYPRAAAARGLGAALVAASAK